MTTHFIDDVHKLNNLIISPGDTVLFKRGCTFRSSMPIFAGTEELPITYSAFGEGANPVFMASTDVSNAEYWEEISHNIWICNIEIPGEVGNFVYNSDECTATLRWEENELSSQGDFWDSRFGSCEKKTHSAKQRILVYSSQNPGNYYNHIECVSYNTRIIGRTQSNIIIENICFKNSGVHGLAGQGKNVVIRNCSFENIGGCVWDRNLKIRFGNAVEFWIYGENILIENCTFKNVYDSCVTHQGPGDQTIPTSNFICRKNTFDTYGMAAFEYRDKLPINSYFSDNTCVNAGCGFAMLGEDLPRNSEIWPLPMGHHIFLWRIDKPTEGGSLFIENNTFGSAPVGSAIYSLISDDAFKQIVIRGNTLL